MKYQEHIKQGKFPFILFTHILFVTVGRFCMSPSPRFSVIYSLLKAKGYNVIQSMSIVKTEEKKKVSISICIAFDQRK